MPTQQVRCYSHYRQSGSVFFAHWLTLLEQASDFLAGTVLYSTEVLNIFQSKTSSRRKSWMFWVLYLSIRVYLLWNLTTVCCYFVTSTESICWRCVWNHKDARHCWVMIMMLCHAHIMVGLSQQVMCLLINLLLYNNLPIMVRKENMFLTILGNLLPDFVVFRPGGGLRHLYGRWAPWLCFSRSIAQVF